MKHAYTAWDLTANFSKPALERVMRAVVKLDAKIVGTYLASGDAWFMASVRIPDGKENEFRDISKAEIAVPPTLQVGMTSIPPRLQYVYTDKRDEELERLKETVGRLADQCQEWQTKCHELRTDAEKYRALCK